jgi:hypothetical protein
MRSKKYIHIPDSPTFEECKDVILGLHFPGDIREKDIERNVTTFLESRDLLPDLLALKKHIRDVFCKRILRIRETVTRNSVIRFTVQFNPCAEPARNSCQKWVEIDLPYVPVRMFRRIPR